MPLHHVFKVDMLNTPKEFGRFEPGETENLLTYNMYLVSNEHIVVHCVSQGRNYIFSDRCNTEILFEFKQSGSSQDTLTVNVSIKGRVVILKPIGPLKSIICAKAEVRMR